MMIVQNTTNNIDTTLSFTTLLKIYLQRYLHEGLQTLSMNF